MNGNERHSRKTLESQWTAEEANEWAWEVYDNTPSHRWPTRRFRVEGSSAGNSSLLDEKTAEATQRKYGGEMKQIIPPKKYAKRPE